MRRPRARRAARSHLSIRVAKGPLARASGQKGAGTPGRARVRVRARWAGVRAWGVPRPGCWTGARRRGDSGRLTLDSLAEQRAPRLASRSSSEGPEGIRVLRHPLMKRSRGEVSSSGSRRSLPRLRLHFVRAATPGSVFSPVAAVEDVHPQRPCFGPSATTTDMRLSGLIPADKLVQDRTQRTELQPPRVPIAPETGGRRTSFARISSNRSPGPPRTATVVPCSRETGRAYAYGSQPVFMFVNGSTLSCGYETRLAFPCVRLG